MTRMVARERVRRRIVRIALVAGIGLALISLLLLLASQPRQAFAKTNSPGVLRQTDTGGALRITGTMGMNSVNREAMGHAMTHLLMAFDTLHEMQQQDMLNSSMIGAMGSTASTTATTSVGNAGSSADVGALLTMMGHMAEAVGYMHEAMGSTAAPGMDNTMNDDWSDLRHMVGILEQMVQVTTNQVPALSGMPGITETGTTTDIMGTGAAGAVTDTTGMGAMTGRFDPSPLLPAMVQTLQAMAGQLRDISGATGMGETGVPTATAGTTGADVIGVDTPTLRQAMQTMGQNMELLGHMHMMLATVNGVSDTGNATSDNGSEMMALVNAMAQAMADHMSIISAPIIATDVSTGTIGAGATTSTMTDTTAMTGTMGMTGTITSDTLGMGSTNTMLNAAAQLLHTTLLQIQGITGGAGGTIAP